jgi:superfamily II DNA or RNA helicase
MILWDYQQRTIEAVREAYRGGYRRPLLVAPCGSGKTIMFSEICASAARRGKRVWILVHRQELLDQVGRALARFEVKHGFIAAGFDPTPATVQVASVMTLVKRDLPPPDLLIIDEAHHATSKSWGTIIDRCPKAHMLGVTATPCRLSGEGLGDVFDTMVRGPSTRELIDQGYLCAPRVFAPPTIDTTGMHTLMGEFVKREVEAAVDKPTVTGNAIEHYQKITPGLKAVVFCVSLEHARRMEGAARSAGLRALMIDGGMDRDIRRRIVTDFAQGALDWLVTVDLVSEGFDVPSIDVGIFLRPTQSRGLWLQQTGRVLRTSPGKTTAWILDHAGNTLRHGFPHEDQEWTLDITREKQAPRERLMPIRVCPKCFSAQYGQLSCIHCGEVFVVKDRTIAETQGELKEITPEERARRQERQHQGRATTLARLEAIARIKGYREGWAQHVYEGRQKR